MPWRRLSTTSKPRANIAAGSNTSSMLPNTASADWVTGRHRWPRRCRKIRKKSTPKHPRRCLNESVSLAHGNDATELFLGSSETPAPLAHDLTGLHLVETEATSGGSLSDEGDDWVEIEEEIEEQVSAHDPLAAGAGFQTSTEGIDDDIREIFLEEMQEEIAQPAARAAVLAGRSNASLANSPRSAAPSIR